MKLSTGSITVSALLGLVACGGTTTPLTFAEITTAGNELGDRIGTAQSTDPTTLPTSGSATYDGYIGATVENDYVVQGEMEMTANFAGAGDLSGRVYNVVGDDGFEYGGELDLDNSTLDRTADTSEEYTFDMDMSGTLNGDGEDWVVDAFLVGDFAGLGHEYIGGAVGGTFTAGGIPQDIIGGGFVGEMR